MIDDYPDTIELDIDRDALRSYLRARWFISWVAGLAFIGGTLGFFTVTSRLDNHDYNGIQEFLSLLAMGIGIWLVVSFVLSTILYFLLSHRLAAVAATSLRVIVEGNFLRIIRHDPARMDQKIHFRSIVDYTIFEDALMRRFGIMSLQMTTTGGGNHASLQILGLRECLDARDKLAAIDALRENR